MRALMGLVVVGGLVLGLADESKAQFSLSIGSPYYGQGVYAGGPGYSYSSYGNNLNQSYYSSAYNGYYSSGYQTGPGVIGASPNAYYNSGYAGYAAPRYSNSGYAGYTTPRSYSNTGYQSLNNYYGAYGYGNYGYGSRDGFDRSDRWFDDIGELQTGFHESSGSAWSIIPSWLD